MHEVPEFSFAATCSFEREQSQALTASAATTTTNDVKAAAAPRSSGSSRSGK